MVRASMWSWVGGACTEAMALLLPQECAGCAQPDVVLCGACRGAISPVPFSVLTPGGLRVGVGLGFEGIAARIVRALKEDGRLGCATSLAAALDAGVGELSAHHPFERADIVVIPVPTSRAAMRRRGYRVAEVLGRRAGLRPARLLAVHRVVADQRGLGRAERHANVAHSMRARGVRGLRIVLIDDVLTTGATLDEAARAVRAAGGEVIGGATVAATPRRMALR